jgi:hypothetical protein
MLIGAGKAALAGQSWDHVNESKLAMPAILVVRSHLMPQICDAAREEARARQLKATSVQRPRLLALSRTRRVTRRTVQRSTRATVVHAPRRAVRLSAVVGAGSGADGPPPPPPGELTRHAGALRARARFDARWWCWSCALPPSGAPPRHCAPEGAHAWGCAV